MKLFLPAIFCLVLLSSCFNLNIETGGSCTGSCIDSIEQKVASCKHLPFPERLQVPAFNKNNDVSIDSYYVSPYVSSETKNCLRQLDVSTVHLIFESGIPTGYLLNLKESEMIIYCSGYKDYDLSLRYRMKRKLSKNLFIVEYGG